jgi:Uma2 family endonuclease
MSTNTEATIDDLYRVPENGKAEIVNAELVFISDYGSAAERLMARKRAEYFAAGTLVVWDVDVLREKLVRVFHANSPEAPMIYRSGDVAEAEPAMPGWKIAVAEIIDEPR